MQTLLNSKAGAFIIGSSWLFFLAAMGYGLFTGKIDFTFFGPVLTALLGAFGYHFASKNGSANSSGNGAGGGLPGA